MKKEFNLNVKIVSDNGRIETKTAIAGEIRGSTLIGVLLEVIPELMKNDRGAIALLCTGLMQGIKPSAAGIGRMTKIDLSDLRKRGGQ